MKRMVIFFLLLIICQQMPASDNSLDEMILGYVEKLTESHFDIYKDLHMNPELTHLEFETAEKMAAHLESIGFDVTTGVGGNGVVGILKNGTGKTILLRTDMDALPIKENTGLPFASTVVRKDAEGIQNPVMHACGHDLHMTVWLGTLRTLVSMRHKWKGTIIALAQPAEEGGHGALSVINDGLFRRFGIPDYALCYHASAELPAGTVGYYPGPIFAGVKSADITVFGSGGHGAMPHTTIDPVVISARIILDIQTIVSRRIDPVKPAVVSVCAVNGGSKHNVIPDEVNMKLTIRYFEEEVLSLIIKSLNDITKGAALAAGLSEDKYPLIKISPEDNPPVSNNPDLVVKSASSMKNILGEQRVHQVNPATVAEDFGQYGRTEEEIPIALFWLGTVNHAMHHDHIAKNAFIPPLHNAAFAPDFHPSFRGGVAAMAKTMIDLFRQD